MKTKTEDVGEVVLRSRSDINGEELKNYDIFQDKEIEIGLNDKFVCMRD
jgi:hypothetical protein